MQTGLFPTPPFRVSCNTRAYFNLCRHVFVGTKATFSLNLACSSQFNQAMNTFTKHLDGEALSDPSALLHQSLIKAKADAVAFGLFSKYNLVWSIVLSSQKFSGQCRELLKKKVTKDWKSSNAGLTLIIYRRRAL
mmetsp:Transcript_19756/g.54413  ORF Transcript_19756/g.54413 Transcript_19756/m.54413 type:complete len:135 (-) Transcript_19756:2771-3175(-)